MPFARLAPNLWLGRLLHPVRWLTARGWLREAEVDAVLARLHPSWRLQRVFARVERRQWVAEDMLALTLRPNGNWPGARPGQHLQLYLECDGVRLCRSYSLTAQHPDGSLEIAIKRQPDGRLSNPLLDRVEVGQVLELGTVAGELRWPAAPQGVLLLAAGSGLTPVLGLLRHALEQGFSAPVTLLHYVRRHSQRAFVDELDALQRRYPNFRVHWGLSGESGDAATLRGRFCAEHLEALPPAAVQQVIACGPGGFVAQVQHWWQQLAAPGDLQLESFSPAHVPQTLLTTKVQLRFARSGQHCTGDNQRSLLQQAEAAGLRPAHGCRQGICASCTCRLLSGAVRDLRNGQVQSEPDQAIRLCVSAPLGDVILDL
ncbi:MAG: ferredoxin reductase [Pseudomonas sp.]|uniref:ferredoxin reductase n=1 Tax=Pseudomonas sp. TaxID=306 RepID=UPI0033992E21